MACERITGVQREMAGATPVRQVHPLASFMPVRQMHPRSVRRLVKVDDMTGSTVF